MSNALSVLSSNGEQYVRIWQQKMCQELKNTLKERAHTMAASDFYEHLDFTQVVYDREINYN